MNEVIREMILAEKRAEEEEVERMIREIDEVSGPIKMYVLTNTQKINGAACMLYEGILSDFADYHGKDLYILPSSVHEVILVLDDQEIKKEDLDHMVKEVNLSEVEEGDVLSDHAYFYNRNLRQIYM
jgi:hypothetical protein